MSATIITSVVTGGTNSHQTVSEELNTYATDLLVPGVVGTITLNSGSGGTGSFCVNQDTTPDMGVTVLAGQAYVLGTPSGQDSQVLRARMASNYTTYVISANSSGSTKYDWIYLQLNPTNATTPDSAADNVINLYTSRSSSNSSDNGSPPTYGLLLAIVTVANGASSITNSNITDKRVKITLSSNLAVGIFSGLYPVGCIYTETTGVNPATTFGFGTWAAFGAGRVLVGNGTSDQAFAAGATGGESNHTLTTAELASHNHSLPNGGTGNSPSNPGAYLNAQWTNGTSGITASSSGSGSAGSGAAHNNLQPYIVVYFWNRTA